MNSDELLKIVGITAATVFGGGGLAALLTVFVNRKLGIKTNENEANKVINTTWEAIVDDLQTQIKDGRTEFTAQLTRIGDKLTKLEERVQKQDEELHFKDRLLLKAIGHITKLEGLVPPNPVPDRPEGLE